MLISIINGKINRGTLFISFSTSVLKSVINACLIVLRFSDLSEHNMERSSCQLCGSRFVTHKVLTLPPSCYIIEIHNPLRDYEHLHITVAASSCYFRF